MWHVNTSDASHCMQYLVLGLDAFPQRLCLFCSFFCRELLLWLYLQHSLMLVDIMHQHQVVDTSENDIDNLARFVCCGCFRCGMRTEASESPTLGTSRGSSRPVSSSCSVSHVIAPSRVSVPQKCSARVALHTKGHVPIACTWRFYHALHMCDMSCTKQQGLTAA